MKAEKKQLAGIIASAVMIILMGVLWIWISSDNQQVSAEFDSLGSWIDYNGIVFGNATFYESEAGGGFAVAGGLTLNRNLDIGSTFSSRYDATQHIGEYKNEKKIPALLYGGDRVTVAPAVTKLDVFGGTIAMSEEQIRQNSEKEVGFQAQEGSGYQELSQSVLDEWFAYQYKIVQQTSELLVQGNPIEISMAELSSGSYKTHGAEYYKNQFFQVNGSIYERALFINVRSTGDVDFGLWWPVHAVIHVDMRWVLDYDLVVFNFPDAVNVTMNSNAFEVVNSSHWSTTVDAWIGETGRQERLAISERVIYNFPNARSISAQQSLVQGTLLAPQASVNVIGASGNGHIYGHIVAKNYTAQGNFTIHAFNLSHWLYDIVEDEISKGVETGNIILRQYLYYDNHPTSVRVEGGEYVLVDENGLFYNGNRGFTDQLELAGVYSGAGPRYDVIQDVPLGKYVLRKLQPPDGFIYNDTEPQRAETYFETDVTVQKSGENVNVLRYAEPIFRDVTFRVEDTGHTQGLSGAQFVVVRQADHFEDTTLGSRFLSDEEGYFTCRNLPIGTYFLVQTHVPEGHGLIEGGELGFTVYWDEESGQMLVKTVQGNVASGYPDDPVVLESTPGAGLGSLMIIKHTRVEEEDSDLADYALKDARYDLYRETEGTGWEKLDINSNGDEIEIVTNELGYYTVAGLDEGRYRLVETAAPQGFQLENILSDDGNTEVFPGGYAYEFVLGEGKLHSTASLINMPLTADIKVILDGLLLGVPQRLPGSSFRLEHLLEDGVTWEELVYLIETDGNGELLFEGLVTGTYRLTQVRASSGYERLEPQEILFTVSFDQENNLVLEAQYNGTPCDADSKPVSLGQEEAWIQIRNEAKTRNYFAYKIDADYVADKDEEGNQIYIVSYLEGAQFRLQRRTGSSDWKDYGGVFESKLLYEGDNPVLDDYGNHIAAAEFSEGLLYGEYRLIETQTPEDYQTNSSIYVTLDDGAAGYQVQHFTIIEFMTGINGTTVHTIADYAESYSTSFVFQKVSAGNLQAPLPGAEFTLYSCDEHHTHDPIGDDSCWEKNTPVVSTGNRAGVYRFGGLTTRDYLLVETEAPAGHKLPLGQWLLTANAVEGIIDIVEFGGFSPGFVLAEENQEVALLLPNQEKFLLPLLGGAGIGAIQITGIILVVCALFYFCWRWIRKKKQNKIRN